MTLKPPFKCPGGKRRLVPELTESLPDDFFSNKKYQHVEPFAGGAAMALHILSQDKSFSKRIVINDSNAHIANLWKTIKFMPHNLMREFNNKFSDKEITKEFFLNIRKNFTPLLKLGYHGYTHNNEIPLDPIIYSPNIAADFLFLNMNCYNGSIRFNKKGQFNAPLGLYKKLQTCNKDNLLKVSEALKNVPIYCSDFQELIKLITSPAKKWNNTFFYFDPPYAPLSDTSHFTYYTAGGFSTFDQFRLKSTIDFLNHAGAKFMLSNSHAEVVKQLYKEYNIREVKASRVINVKGKSRGKIIEYIITNY